MAFRRIGQTEQPISTYSQTDVGDNQITILKKNKKKTKRWLEWQIGGTKWTQWMDRAVDESNSHLHSCTYLVGQRPNSLISCSEIWTAESPKSDMIAPRIDLLIAFRSKQNSIPANNLKATTNRMHHKQMASVVLICVLVHFLAAFPILQAMLPVRRRADFSTSARRAKFKFST